MFTEKMTSEEARKKLFQYAKEHKEIPNHIKKEYKEVMGNIIKRELKENAGWLTE